MEQKKVVIIGGGLGGLATAALLAKEGYRVELYEKHQSLGGRCGILKKNGYTFDTGPSWYLMPDVFEHFFKLLGEDIDLHLRLKKLEPSYRVFFKDEDRIADVTGDLEKDLALFEELEPGVSPRMRDYLKKSEYKYGIALKTFVYKNYDSIRDFLTWQAMTKGLQLHIFEKMESYVRRFFKSEAIQKIMQYTLVFLGSSPYDTPAMYSIMSHVDFNMGVYYPDGGMYTLTEALVNIGKKHGVAYHTNSNVQRILLSGTGRSKRARGVELGDGSVVEADIVISNSDVWHTDTVLLPPEGRTHTDAYWQGRTLAPSALILYLGVKGRIPSLLHHNLIFSKDWKQNFDQLFSTPCLPDDPSIYVCAPSVTDPTVAPEGKENIFVLVPIAAGVEYTRKELEAYGDKVIDIMETTMGISDFKNRIEYRKTYSAPDYLRDYHTLGGSALGLAHTLFQTAVFRPLNRNPKVNDLYYVGAGTTPGIGMPMVLVGAELVLKRLRGDRSAGPLPTDAVVEDGEKDFQ